MEKYQPTPEEIAKNQESRTLSDAELIERGAHYIPTESGNPRLEVTPVQEHQAKKEMTKELNEERRKSMSKEEIRAEKAELAQKVSDIAQIIAKRVNGKIREIYKGHVSIGQERDSSGSMYQYDVMLEGSDMLDGSNDKIFVKIDEYFPGDSRNDYYEEFSSSLTADQIASAIPIRSNKRA